MAKIDLAHLLDIEDKSEYKIHFAKQADGKRPLDIFINEGKKAGEVGSAWWGWHSWYSGRNRWKGCKYILSFIRVYPEGGDVWLFGGIFEVRGLSIPEGEKAGEFYDVKLTDKGKEYIGHLKIRYRSSERLKYLWLENVYPNLEFSEILKARYSGVTFPGYKNISLDFPDIESIVDINRDDWRTALSMIKGIYIIFDKKTGKKYVGSAYGEGGIWNRWCAYVHSLHGGNKELKELLKEHGLQEISQKENPRDYVRENFRFTLAEWISDKDTVDKSDIIKRESFWKEALLSRGKFGYNAN